MAQDRKTLSIQASTIPADLTPRKQTIRNRLLVAFTALVLLPVLVSTFVSSVLNADHAQRHITAQLQSVATIKEAEIQTWLENLKNDLVITALHEDDRAGMRILMQAETDPVVRANAYKRIKLHFQEIINKTHRYTDLLLLDSTGTIVLATDTAQEGKSYPDSRLFQEGLVDTYIQPPTSEFSPGEVSVLVAQPLHDLTGQTIGVLAGRASMDALEQIMLEQTGLGKTGETYLVNSDYTLLTPSRFEGFLTQKTKAQTHGATSALVSQINGASLYSGYRNTQVFGVYRWLPDLQVALLAEQEESEALRSTSQILYINIGLSIAAVAAAIIAGLVVTRSISNPLIQLTRTATEIAAGNLDMVAEIERQDEIGALAQAFNSMTARLRALISSLEERISARTEDLERRTTYLEAAAEVGRAAATILDPERLAHQAVESIRQRFGLYYVGLFRVDETGQWAVLQAGTGEAGKAMLARGHRIKVGEGMIGWSIANAEARIASQAETDAVRLTNPELPLTRSEAALPLRTRGRVLGAITVQSAHPDAFDPGLLTVLQTMADQIAIAIDNARLLAESEAAIEAQRRAYGELSRQAWQQLLRTRPGLGFRRSGEGRAPITALQETDSAPAAGKVALSIKSRDQVIGRVVARRSADNRPWTEAEKELLESLVEQLGLVLEDAQLFYASQRSAQREQIQRQITEKVRAAPDIQTIAQTAVEELVKALGGDGAFVKLNPETTESQAGENGHA